MIMTVAKVLKLCLLLSLKSRKHRKNATKTIEMFTYPSLNRFLNRLRLLLLLIAEVFIL